MICYNCNLISICKVFEITKNVLPSINIIVNNCQFCLSNNIVPPTTSKTVFTNRSIARSPDELLSISARIKDAEQNPVNTATTATKTPIAKCEICDKELLETDIVKCVACNKILCENCVTYDITLAFDNSYCETCWHTTPDIPLSN